MHKNTKQKQTQTHSPGGALSDGVVSRALTGPHKVQRTAKGLVAQGLAGVDNVLSITADNDERPVAVVGHLLGVDLTGSEVTHVKGQALAVHQFRLLGQA